MKHEETLRKHGMLKQTRRTGYRLHQTFNTVNMHFESNGKEFSPCMSIKTSFLSLTEVLMVLELDGRSETEGKNLPLVDNNANVKQYSNLEGSVDVFS